MRNGRRPGVPGIRVRGITSFEEGAYVERTCDVYRKSIVDNPDRVEVNEVEGERAVVLNQGLL